MTKISAVSDQGICSCPVGKRPAEEFVQSELLDEFQRQPRAAELPAVLDAHARAVDLDEPRLGAGLREQFALPRRRLRIGGLLDAQPAGFIHQSQVGHGALPRAALGAIRLDQRPIGFALAVPSAEMGSQEHAAMLAAIRADLFPLHALTLKNLADRRPDRHRDTTYVRNKIAKKRVGPIFSKPWGSWANSCQCASDEKPRMWQNVAFFNPYSGRTSLFGTPLGK